MYLGLCRNTAEVSTAVRCETWIEESAQQRFLDVHAASLYFPESGCGISEQTDSEWLPACKE